VHQPRRLIQILLRQMIPEHVRRLNNVIINADQDHVFLVHAPFLQRPLLYGQQFSDAILPHDNLRRREVMMARILPSTVFASVPVDGLGQGDRINLGVAAILGHALGSLMATLQASGTLPPRLVELVRLRIAFNNQCRSCMSVRYQSVIDNGLTEGAVCSLEQPAKADDLSDSERSALRFADLFATNHLSIDDSVCNDLRRYFTEDELLELGVHCAYALGIGRLTATWNVTDDVPDAFRSASDSPVAPWVSEGVVASG
jgi:alkylhydroperoxidase family enzyme